RVQGSTLLPHALAGSLQITPSWLSCSSRNLVIRGFQVGQITPSRWAKSDHQTHHGGRDVSLPLFILSDKTCCRPAVNRPQIRMRSTSSREISSCRVVVELGG